jgi:hypothetical protein
MVLNLSNEIPQAFGRVYRLLLAGDFLLELANLGSLCDWVYVVVCIAKNAQFLTGKLLQILNL